MYDSNDMKNISLRYN